MQHDATDDTDTTAFGVPRSGNTGRPDADDSWGPDDERSTSGSPATVAPVDDDHVPARCGDERTSRRPRTPEVTVHG